MANIIKQFKDTDGNNIYPIAYARGGVKMDPLWTSSAESLSAQTINLDLSDYDMVLVFAWAGGKDWDRGNKKTIQFAVPKGVSETFFSNIGSYLIWRQISVADNGVTFGGGYYASGYDGSATGSSNTFVPTKIYGIKMSYVVPTTVHGLQYVEV